ncbi:MAG: DUF58 domain-containing protein [candidate division WOR-3 bacterium]
MELLKPEVLEKVRALNLRAKIVVKGFLTGLHESPYHGFSLEFKQHRPYYQGDPINKINWKLYARTERFYIKKYQAETNLSSFLLLDKSNSMGFGEKISKFHYARTLAASLAYLLLKQNDSVGLVLFDSDIKSFIPPRSRTSHLKHLLGTLSKNEPSGETSVSSALFQLAPLIKKRSLCILFSDLLEEPEKIIKSINVMKAKKHEFIVFQILDKKELDFPYRGESIFKDMENSRTIQADPESLRVFYKDRFDRFISSYKNGFAPHHIDYFLVTTDIPYDKALTEFLEKRKRLS